MRVPPDPPCVYAFARARRAAACDGNAGVTALDNQTLVLIISVLL